MVSDVNVVLSTPYTPNITGKVYHKNCSHRMPDCQIAPNSMYAWATPQTPLAELTVLTRLLSWIWVKWVA